MRWRFLQSFSLGLSLTVIPAGPEVKSLGVAVQAPSTRPTTPADDPIRALIFARRDGAGDSFPHMVDLPLWASTRYLLEGDPRARLLGLLDALVSRAPGQSAVELRRRALLQHELWQLFDWTLKDERTDAADRVALRRKLAVAIRHVALKPAEIQSLATNLQPTTDENPPDVLDEGRGWVSLGMPGSTAVAEVHMMQFGGRSAFGVFLRLPEGRAATVAYLDKLAEAPFEPNGTTMRSRFFEAHPPPQFTPGTQVALLRRMLLIDTSGQIVCSPITQSLQIRTFLKLTAGAGGDQVRMQEYQLDQNVYLENAAGALRALGPADREPIVFMSMDFDPFQQPAVDSSRSAAPLRPVLESCVGCHGSVGVLSLNSFKRTFTTFSGNPKLQDLSFQREVDITCGWKQQQATWGMLRGYWEAIDN